MQEGGLHFSISFLFCSSIVVIGGGRKRIDAIVAMIVQMAEWDSKHG